MTDATFPQNDLDRWATTREIKRQPAIWRSFGPRLATIAAEVTAWIAERRPDEIWFCGAGTSAFVGETLASYLNTAPGPIRFRAIPSTDLIAAPRSYLRPGIKLLVVSFGRSGNSSETIGTLDLLADHAPEADRLHITCNANSALARTDNAGPGELRNIVLPPETDDSGFAMTSSYTTMLLTALAVFDPAPPAPVAELMGRLADGAEALLAGQLERLIALPMPERAVFLGSGPLTGSSRESALKVLELAAGQIPTSWDSTLGFRHGPKAITNAETRVFVLLSSDPHTRRYDTDLATEVGAQFGADVVLRLGDPAAGADIPVPSVGNDAWSSVLYVMVAQLLSVIWSHKLGLTVDNPFASGNLTRVVAGVKLYPLPETGPQLFGALDVGGTKIEARLFDSRLEVLERQRFPTAKGSYEELLEALQGAVGWLDQVSGTKVELGVGLPGLIDPATGISMTSNVPATGHTLSADLSARIGRAIPVENDCKCFALSEANGGAGAGYRTVFGLILGTGVGGGVTVDGKLVVGHNGLPGEVGHFGLPAELVQRHNLPILSCGCGRTGCYETLLSGPGMGRIAQHLTGETVDSSAIVARAAAGDAAMRNVLDIWFDILGELIHTIQLTIDADCVVIGGGLSNIDGLVTELSRVFAPKMLPGVRQPAFATARFGDASGVRGAAMLVAGGRK